MKTSKLIQSTAMLAALCLIGRPSPAFGDSGDDGYDPASGPLHGNPDPGAGQANAVTDKRDERHLANRALDATQGVQKIGGTDSEILALLARAEEIKDGDAMPRRDIVEIRLNLQRFRQQSDELARRVDEEVNRLEAILLDVKIKKGQSITGQTRNLPAPV